ncbi:hypothetical protein H0H87_000250 [Tephrocybe sp. NHM501043]|nr:hypothetical protein H0H87_000250 [Tephrocybe sp. NHM501043]
MQLTIPSPVDPSMLAAHELGLHVSLESERKLLNNNIPTLNHRLLQTQLAQSSQEQAPPTQHSPHPQPNHDATIAEKTEALPDGILLSADIASFHYEQEEFWFRIDAIFQPFAKPGQRLPPAKQLTLFRVYNDFYDFQVLLLETYPREAGRESRHPRVLPYMPGPAEHVDNALTESRRSELDAYVHSLCDLNKSGGKYILESPGIREFLALKPGDVGIETDPRVEEMEELYGQQQARSGSPGDLSDLRDNLGWLKSFPL